MTSLARLPRTAATVLLFCMTIAFPSALGASGAAAAVEVPRTLYVSAAGNDGNDGRSPATAWGSLYRVSIERLAPGDRVLLEGGATFEGPLDLDARDAGDATRPVVIDSYGTGRATVSARFSNGISVHNTAGVQIADVRVSGGQIAYEYNAGISFYNDLRGNRKLDNVKIQRVEVSGFRTGIRIGGFNGTSGFRDVLVAHSSVHDNMTAGLSTYGPDFDVAAPSYAIERVRVYRVTSFRNLGDPDEPTRNTGSGIILGSVRGGVVEYSRAYGNGAASRTAEGPVGIWAYDSHGVVLQHNVAHDNRTGGGDGGGFDLDQNVTSSTMQYNTSYGNDGPGYLLFGTSTNTAHRNNVVRFNVSSGDARRSAAYGGISVMGRVTGAQIYHNTVVMKGSSLVAPPALKILSGASGVKVRNNVLVSASAGPVVVAPRLGRSAVLLQGNAYAALGRTWRVQWGARTYGSLSGWRTATRQEYVGARATGRTGNPKLIDPYRALTVTNPTYRRGAAGLKLRSDSPLLKTGLSLRTLYGTKIGGRDYFGTAISATTTVHDVGAYRRPR